MQGVCDDSNFWRFGIIWQQGRRYLSGSEHVSIALGDIEYTEIYRELADKRSYNMRLVDGALLQMMYRIEGDELLPAQVCLPTLHQAYLPFQDESDAYK